MNLESAANIIYHLMGAAFFYVGVIAMGRLVNILPRTISFGRLDGDEVEHKRPTKN